MPFEIVVVAEIAPEGTPFGRSAISQPRLATTSTSADQGSATTQKSGLLSQAAFLCIQICPELDSG